MPSEFGGVELGFTAACLAIEEVAKVDPAVSALMDRADGWRDGEGGMDRWVGMVRGAGDGSCGSCGDGSCGV